MVNSLDLNSNSTPIPIIILIFEKSLIHIRCIPCLISLKYGHYLMTTISGCNGNADQKQCWTLSVPVALNMSIGHAIMVVDCEKNCDSYRYDQILENMIEFWFDFI